MQWPSCNPQLLQEMLQEPYRTLYHEEHKTIFLRAGMDPNDNNLKKLEICTTHRSILGKDFIQKSIKIFVTIHMLVEGQEKVVG